MEKNTPKTDRRTRRTRQALYHGLIQLLEDKPVAEISVKELCQVCDLNRSTFYLHYASVQELLEAMEQEILEGLNEVLDKFDAAFMQSPDPVPRDAALAEAFQFLSDRSEFCQVILSRRSDPDFIDQVKAVVRSRCLNQWAQLLDRGLQTAEAWLGAGPIRIEAQTYAKGFYAKFGFRQVSQEFLEDGIPHIQMLRE